MSRTRRTINSKNNSVIALCLNREIIFRAAFLAAAIWIAAVGADAATLTVTKTADTNDAVCNGDCSLREAIGAAASGDTIAFSLLFSTAQTIALTDQLLFAKSLTIAGPGARLLTISGMGLHRAFRMDGAATVNIRNVKIANSFDAEAGGCIQIFTDITLNLTDVQLELCRSVSGAAIWSRGTLNMIRSTITTASLGAAIYLDGGTANIANSTIKNNSIGSALPVAGIHVTNSGILKLNNATIADNDGEAVRVSSGTAYLRNTIVRAVNPSLADMSGTIVSLGNNLVGKNVGISTAFPAGNPNVNGDIVGSANSIVNPQLHTLANNGGQTDTSASFPNSPAIDRGNACVVTAACSQHNPPAALNTDQRGTGFLRMFNNFVDIGAYESTDVPAPIITSLSSPTRGAGTGSFQLTVFGSGFTAGVLGSVVRWQGQDRATTFISPTELRATILASDVQSVGQFEVRVFNAVPSGGGNDSWVLLTVVNCQISSPASAVNLSSGGGSVAAPVATAGGCGWTGTANAAWITDLTPSGAGAGTASFNVLPNPGPARMAVVTLALPSNGMAFQITVAQASGCTYTLSPISRSINSAANSGDLSMNAGSGCTWTALSSASWISVTAGSAGNGNGTISYTVQSNPTPLSRTATITAGGQTFTLTQSGTTMSVGDCSIVEGNSGTANCYFRVSLSAASAQTVSFTYVTVSRSATADEDFVHTSGFASILPGQTFFDLGVPVIGDIVVEGNETFGVVLTFPSNASVVGPEGRGTIINDDQVRRARADFDGDGKTDIGIFRGSGGEWWINRSSNGSTFALQFGAPTDRIVPGDFTGDGKADIAFWRPSTGEWYVLRSENNSFFAFPFGTNGDIPVPADYDGDGKTDAAVFRPSTATWFISNSFGGTTITQFGAAGDQPVPADYDDDGHADIAIYRPSLGQWWLNRSTAGVTALTFGTNTDKAVPADYTGDGKADVAFWRPSTGEWFVLRSENQSYYAVPFGTNGDKPAPGDYDGDGKADLTIFRPSSATWYVQRTTAGTLIQQFGANGDQPTANAFVP